MLEGEISQINLVERLVEQWREQFTGAIRFESEGIIKILYFKSGDILSASTNDRSDSIDEILMRAGKVSREHVKQALAKRKESETLGDALLNLGFITRKELTWARRVQVVGVIRSIAAWTEGSFTIVADYLPKRDEGTLFPLPQVLIELAVTEQDRARFERELEGGSAVFAKAADFDRVWHQLGLNEEADRIASEIDGDKSANEIATASGGETFNVYKLLYGLSTLGVVTRVAKPQVSPEFVLDDFASAGVADAADLWGQPVVAQEPDVAAMPSFELDSDVDRVDFASNPEPASPASDTPVLSFDAEPEPEGGPVIDLRADTEPELSFDDEPADVSEPPRFEQPSVRLPAWEAPPRQPLATPVPGALVTEKEEELGGFDEAQLETARRAAIPPSAAVPRTVERKPVAPARRSRKGLWITLAVLAILAAGGYFGTQWWLQQQEAAAVTEPVRTVDTATAPPLTTAPPAVSTIASVGTDGATVTIQPAAVDTAAISTQAPNVTPAPAVVTPAPVAAPPTAAPAVVPAAPAAASAVRERLDAMARDFAANPRGNFTVQIQILCDPGNLQQAMRTGGDSVWFVPQTIGGRSCYRVFWGRFETREQAQQALSQVPAALRDRSAAVKPVPGR